MRPLIQEYLPTAPDLGLFVAPEIPEGKLYAALRDYARDTSPEAVIALYDATRLGSAKDGALFLSDRVLFQNNDLQEPRSVRYEDIVGVQSKRLLLGGKRVVLEVNKGRATITEQIDFSAQAGAAEYVERFLREAMLQSPRDASATVGTDWVAVRAALDDLQMQGSLLPEDYQRLSDVIDRAAAR